MNIQTIIEDIMMSNNLSQDKLAKILGVSQKAISNWKSGNDKPKADSLILIYEKFGITPNEVLGIEEYKGISKSWQDNYSSYTMIDYHDDNTKFKHIRKK